MSIKKFLAVFLLGIVTDLVLAAYTIFLTREQIVLASIMCLLIPYTVLIEAALFADATTWRERIWISTSAGLGSAVGTVIVMLTARLF